MPTKKLKPVHPGQVLKHDFLEPMGIPNNRLAIATGISRIHIGRVVNGTRGISADMSLRLARFFGTSPELWMNLQNQYELDIAADKNSEIVANIKPWPAQSQSIHA